jgi:hypothetical protein
MDIDKLNDEQKQFLFSSNKNILVSASAGSGKTTTMIEKIMFLIDKEKANVKNMLIVTFTDSAASEMKQKLFVKLTDYANVLSLNIEQEKSSENKEKLILDRLHIINNIENINLSDIGTFHSICKKLISKYFYLLDIDPSFKILAEQESKVLLNDATNDVFLKYIENHDDLFYTLQETFNKKRKDTAFKKVVGNGASITAVKNGISIDTSMGFTPLEGLVMGTRCGDLDPAIPIYMQQTMGFSVQDVNNILNKKSGMLGLSHISNDMRQIEEEIIEHQNPDAIRAHDVYAYRIKKYIGSYAAAMNGVDVVIFTGGVGENMPILRSLVCKDMDWMGIVLDEKANDRFGGGIFDQTAENSRVKILKVPTNEELMIALETERLLTRD